MFFLTPYQPVNPGSFLDSLVYSRNFSDNQTCLTVYSRYVGFKLADKAKTYSRQTDQ
ncbi:hypothetical protein L873DRAFT_1822783 [Choiromyces venosus 120613-1]|uniref:Uncharacterized protein n=1 Tax=Choiromyces venosus 120613-1 TaxID=1336337 RepID=A0A3N4ITI1_9PEZI|nr:hypothetical protein L873DRAFT_1822783 [Choiromyces venosus 120613-1]